MGGDRSISIHAFAQAEDIDPLYYTGVSHYLMPDGAAGQKPYALLQAAMSKDGLYALGDVVLGGRQQLVVLPRPARIDHQRHRVPVRGPRPLGFLPAQRRGSFFHAGIEPYPGPDCRHHGQTSRSGTISRSIRRETAPLIEAKIAGKDIAVAPSEEPRAVVNLMDALRRVWLKCSTSSQRARQKSRPAASATPAQARRRDPSAERGATEGQAAVSVMHENVSSRARRRIAPAAASGPILRGAWCPSEWQGRIRSLPNGNDCRVAAQPGLCIALVIGQQS